MDRRQLIERYRNGYQAVVAALENVDDIDASADGGWSARQVVHHLADAEMTGAIRLRRLLVEDAPHIDGYDEEEFARRLHYNRPIDASLAAFKAARDTTAEILELLTEDDWKRTGTHSERGSYSVEAWLEVYAEHAYVHADQIARNATEELVVP